MVRRVGFGDAAAGARGAVVRAGGDAGSGRAADAGGPAREAALAAARRVSPVAQVVIVLALLAWLAGWSWGISFAVSALAEVWNGMDGGAADLGALAFLGVWLAFALVGWAFGVVIVVVLLFGKPISEERRREKEARRAARRQAREARRGG